MDQKNSILSLRSPIMTLTGQGPRLSQPGGDNPA
jgi:hypothetical protein